MKILIKATVVIMLLTCTTLFASADHTRGHGSGHAHTKSEIKDIAQKELVNLVRIGEIDKTWLNKSIVDIKEKHDSYFGWRVSFKNKQIKDKSKQILHIDFNVYGRSQGYEFTEK